MNDPEGFIDPEGLRIGFYVNRAYWNEQNATTIENLCWLSLELEPDTIKPLGNNAKEYFTVDGWRYFLQLKEEHQQRCRDTLGQLNVGGIGLAPLNGDDVSTGRAKQYEIKICEFCEWAIAQAWDKRPFGLGMLKRINMPDHHYIVLELGEAPLSDAIKLSLGISISTKTPEYLDGLLGRRLAVTKARLRCNEDETINIRKFGDLATSMKWWLPHNFPTTENTNEEENQNKPDNTFLQLSKTAQSSKDIKSNTTRECQLHTFIWRVYHALSENGTYPQWKKVWSEIQKNHEKYDGEAIIQQVTDTTIFWESDERNEQKLEHTSLPATLSKIKKKYR